MRGSAGWRCSAGVSDWHTSALERDNCCCISGSQLLISIKISMLMFVSGPSPLPSVTAPPRRPLLPHDFLCPSPPPYPLHLHLGIPLHEWPRVSVVPFSAGPQFSAVKIVLSRPRPTYICRVPPVAYQVILEPGVLGQFREFESPRVHARINSLGLFLVHKLTCGKRESVS